jgi:hypothetical protein
VERTPKLEKEVARAEKKIPKKKSGLTTRRPSNMNSTHNMLSKKNSLNK